MTADSLVRERDDWQRTLADWRARHDALTARLVAIEEEINQRTYHLFSLTPADIRTLEDSRKRTKTFYPLGHV